MPLVFDIADKMRGNSVFDMARDKRQSDDLHKIRKQGLEAAEYQQSEYEANRGTRDAVNSAQKQQAIGIEQQAKIDQHNQRLMEFGNVAKGVNADNYQQMLPRLKELMPDGEFDAVWDETTQGEIDALIPMIDDVAQKQQHIEYLKRVEASGGPNAAAASSMIDQLYQEQLKAQYAYALEVEERLAGINKDNAKAARDRAVASAGGGVSGVGGTALERAGAAVRQYASAWRSGAELSDDERTAAANALDIKYPARSVTRTLSDGAIITVRERNIPTDVRDFAKDILGEAYGSETIRGEGRSTKKEIEEARTVKRELGKVPGVIEQLKTSLETFPSWGMGISGDFAGTIGAIQEWATNNPSEFNRAKAVVDSQFTRLETVVKPLVDKGVFSKDDWKKVEALVGNGAWATKSSAAAALDVLNSMIEESVAAYERYEVPVDGDSGRVIDFSEMPD